MPLQYHSSQDALLKSIAEVRPEATGNRQQKGGRGPAELIVAILRLFPDALGQRFTATRNGGSATWLLGDRKVEELVTSIGKDSRIDFSDQGKVENGVVYPSGWWTGRQRAAQEDPNPLPGRNGGRSTHAAQLHRAHR